MTLMLLRPLAWLILCIAYATAQAADKVQAAGAIFDYSGDNENFYTRRIGLEYLPSYAHADFLSGVRYTEHHYEQNTWSRDGKQLSILHRQIDPATANGWQMAAGIFSQGQHDLLTTDINYRTMLTEGTGLEMFVNRDWVETAAALDQGVNFTFGGIAMDQVINRHFTIVGLAGLQNFSDDNFRNHGRVKLIFQPDTDLGLTLQLRYRSFTSSSSNVGGAYFNPGQYDETMLALGWRQRVSGWMANLTAGTGQQKVASDPATPTLLLDIGLQSPSRNKNYAFRISAIMSRSASFNGPDYRYSYLHAEWILAM
jgi:hypothetical protein